MRFVRVLGPELQGDRRWLMLSMADRGAWISLAIIASSTDGVIADRETAELLLRREGAENPAESVARLVELGLVEVAESGEVRFPVGIDWMPRAPSAEPEKVLERVRRHRGVVTESPPVVTETTGNESETTRGEERRQEEEEPVTAPQPNPFVIYRDLTDIALTGRAEQWMNDYIRRYGAERVSAALRTAWDGRPDPDGLLDRLKPLLNGGGHRPSAPPPTVEEQLDALRRDPLWIDGRYRPDELLPGAIRDAYEAHLQELERTR